MKTYYFSGNLLFGMPYVIISGKEEANYFASEIFIVFDSAKPLFKYGILGTHKYSKVFSFDAFIEYERRFCEDYIFYKMVQPLQSAQASATGFLETTKLKPDSEAILGLFKTKFSAFLNAMIDLTQIPEFKKTAMMYESFIIEQTAFSSFT